MAPHKTKQTNKQTWYTEEEEMMLRAEVGYYPRNPHRPVTSSNVSYSCVTHEYGKDLVGWI